MKCTKQNIKMYCNDLYHDEDGYWAILKPCYCYDHNSRCLHEDTLKELVEAFNAADVRFTLGCK